jgi:flagellar protein FliL
VLVLLTAVTGAVGFLSGNHLRVATGLPAQPQAASTPPPPAAANGRQVVTLPVVLTNLGGEGGGWVRLEAGAVFESDKPMPAELAARLAEDFTALLRTLSMQQLASASGFQHLREDLTERARTRSGGKVREVTIQAMVIE